MEAPSATPLIDKESVAEYWSTPNLIQEQFSSEIYWLANRHVNERYRTKACGGASGDEWYVAAVKKYFGHRMPVERMLSIGCGEGGLELSLAPINAFQAMDAWDVASGSIRRAKQYAADSGYANIHYDVRDIETAHLPVSTFDAVWFNMSLHHIGALEKVLSQIAKALKPDGLLLFNEYVGPNRFAFTEREKAIAAQVFHLLPEKYRRSCAWANRGTVLENMAFPDPIEVERTDPSESIRSGDILPVAQSLFEIIEWNHCGGTILHFLLGNIVGNFRDDDPALLEMLRMLFDIEDRMIAAGEIRSHFDVVVARPKSCSRLE